MRVRLRGSFGRSISHCDHVPIASGRWEGSHPLPTVSVDSGFPSSKAGSSNEPPN